MSITDYFAFYFSPTSFFDNVLHLILIPSFGQFIVFFCLVFLLRVSAYLIDVNRRKTATAATVTGNTPRGINSDNPSPLTYWIRFLATGVNWFLFGILAAVFLIGAAQYQFTTDAHQVEIYNAFDLKSDLICLGIAVIFGFLAAYFFNLYMIGRRFSVWLNARDTAFLKSHISRKGSESDVKNMRDILPENIEYDPVALFDEAKARDLMLLGLDEKQKAVTVPRATWVKSHVQVMGPPGTGKGVVVGITLSQAIGYGDAVFWFDPKNDQWASSVMASACEKAGVPFVVVNLQRGQPAQINPFHNVTRDELYELLETGFSLGERGTEADHYRLGDRDAAWELCQMVDTPSISASELYRMAHDHLPKSVLDKAEGFMSKLKELTRLTATQTAEGVDMRDFVERGGCLYVIGHTRDDVVIRMQRMLVMRLVQMREAMPHHRRHVTGFLDEIKYLLSKPVLNALGTVRDKGMNFLLAHQSMGDLGSVPNVELESARREFLDCTPIRWFYRNKDFDVAEWISNMTGQTTIDTARRSVTRNEGYAERVEAEVVLMDKQKNLIDTNQVQNLPDGCAVCIGAGIAKLAYANPIRVEKRTFSVPIAPQIQPDPIFEPVMSATEPPPSKKIAAAAKASPSDGRPTPPPDAYDDVPFDWEEL
ncbi:type IV secretory system conjugative DNA transfer family protein [Citrobacter sp. JL978]|uniref:type IV secretory system conjugative DNA transfer family protein n=1 Tax=Citrobacter sp. JL978 TaxID=2652398 RepID=UPI0012D9B071|nr:type IV secretory system conjugative DNA transfer family protein [Citrobacter sp. JL978]MTZ83909.1 TraM recognition domain-containing protein [Citrobacter sp. JL978]